MFYTHKEFDLVTRASALLGSKVIFFKDTILFKSLGSVIFFYINEYSARNH